MKCFLLACMTYLMVSLTTKTSSLLALLEATTALTNLSIYPCRIEAVAPRGRRRTLAYHHDNLRGARDLAYPTHPPQPSWICPYLHIGSKRLLLAGDNAPWCTTTATYVGQGIWHVPHIHHTSVLHVATQEDSIAYTFTIMKVHMYPSPSSLIMVGLCWWGSLILEVGWLLHNIWIRLASGCLWRCSRRQPGQSASCLGSKRL